MTNKIKRIKLQESGNVIRWYEGKGITGSLVKGDFPNENELRVSNKKGSMKARGVFKNISDEHLIQQIETLNRSIKFNKSKDELAQEKRNKKLKHLLTG